MECPGRQLWLAQSMSDGLDAHVGARGRLMGGWNFLCPCPSPRPPVSVSVFGWLPLRASGGVLVFRPALFGPLPGVCLCYLRHNHAEDFLHRHRWLLICHYLILLQFPLSIVHLASDALLAHSSNQKQYHKQLFIYSIFDSTFESTLELPVDSSTTALSYKQSNLHLIYSKHVHQLRT